MPELGSLRASNVPLEEMTSSVWEDAGAVTHIAYPVLSYSPPNRLVVNAEQPEICDNIQGLVGQYLLLSTGAFNFADHRGAGIAVEIGEPFEAAAISNNDQMSLF